MLALNHPFCNTIKESCDNLGQIAAVSLAFFIPISTAMTSVCTLIVVLTWLLGSNQSEKWRTFLQHPLIKYVYPLIFLTLLGITYSAASQIRIQESVCDILRLALIPILIYFYRHLPVAKMALWAFVGGMIITLVLAFLKIYAGFPIGLKYTEGAVFKSHIKTSYFMAIAAFFIASQCKEINPLRLRLILFLMVVLMIYYLLFMSAGRIGYLTVVACLFVLAWQEARTKGLLLAFALTILLLGGAYLTSDVLNARLNLLIQDVDFYQQGGRLLESSLGSRLQFAKTSSQLLLDKPFFGWGTGGFEAAYAKIHEHEKTLLTDNPHNEYLLIGVELGLVGLWMLLCLFYQQWRLSHQLWQGLRGFYQGFLLTFVLGCFFNSWLKDSAEGYFFCVITAICFSTLPVTMQSRLVNVTLH